MTVALNLLKSFFSIATVVNLLMKLFFSVLLYMSYINSQSEIVLRRTQSEQIAEGEKEAEAQCYCNGGGHILGSRSGAYCS